MYMPPEETVMTRAGAAARSAGSRSSVSAKGPRTLVANVSSTPGRVALASLQKHAGVVDEHGELRLALVAARRRACAPHRARRGRRARATCSVGARSTRVAARPAREHARRAPGRARPGARAPRLAPAPPPSPRRSPSCAGDDRRAAPQAAGHGALPAQAAQPVADRRVAGSDRDVEGGVASRLEQTLDKTWTSIAPARCAGRSEARWASYGDHADALAATGLRE